MHTCRANSTASISQGATISSNIAVGLPETCGQSRCGGGGVFVSAFASLKVDGDCLFKNNRLNDRVFFLTNSKRR